MKTKELQNKILEYYKECLSNLPKDFKKAKDYIYKKSIQNGICNCALEVFKEDIYSNIWTKLKGEYWGELPRCAENTENIKKCLELRINILTEILSK